jgi:hypothetical protein
MQQDVEKIKNKLIPEIREAKKKTGWETQHSLAFSELCGFIESNFADDLIGAETLARRVALIDDAKDRLLEFFEKIPPRTQEEKFYVEMKQCVEVFWSWNTIRNGNEALYGSHDRWVKKTSVSPDGDIIRMQNDVIPRIRNAQFYITGYPDNAVDFQNLRDYIENNFADDRIDAEKNATPQTPALTAALQAKLNEIEQRLNKLEAKVNAPAKKSSTWGWGNSSHIDTLLEKMNDYNTDV